MAEYTEQEIDRYKVVPWDSYSADMEYDPHGNYVRYRDHVDALNRAQQEIAEARELLSPSGLIGDFETWKERKRAWLERNKEQA